MPSGFVPLPLPRLMRRSSDKINLLLMTVRSFLSFPPAFALRHRFNRGMNQAHECLPGCRLLPHWFYFSSRTVAAPDCCGVTARVPSAPSGPIHLQLS